MMEDNMRKGMDIYMHMTGSLHRTAEIGTSLLTNYTFIKKTNSTQVKKKKIWREMNSLLPRHCVAMGVSRQNL